MPRKSRLKLPPVSLGNQSVGQRLACLRKQRGLTQVQLAEKIGIIQALVSAYELDRLRLNADMLVRFTQALRVSADEILGLKKPKGNGHTPSLKVARRMKRIDSLPREKQRALLNTIDTLLKGVEK
jgi:transcriptional regulator with XRE-family HTH domain